MLVFLSDLHFVDGTAGEHNVPAKAFEGVFKDLAAHARDANAQEVKIVFLGDIFDLLRTEEWFKVLEEERPWGITDDPQRQQKMEKKAGEILQAILEKNRQTFELLGGKLQQRFDFPVEPERVYLVGNHDRLCARIPSLLQKAKQALGVQNPSLSSLHHYMDPPYGVFARHGHEYDVFNYEGGDSFEDRDYLRIPIGDPITTELVARLPYTILNNERAQKLPDLERQALQRNLQEIENVRPLSATLQWLFYQVRRDRGLRDIIEEAVNQVIGKFKALKFVQDWYRRHDRWTNVWDEADKLQAVLFFLEKLQATQAEAGFSLAEKLKGAAPDPLREAAQKEFLHLDSDIYYVVYGHTHEPLQLPIQVVDDPRGGQRELVYLNTGTWRARHQEALARGFVSWKQLTYTLFYTEKEDLAPSQRSRGFPTFETWTGALKETFGEELPR